MKDAQLIIDEYSLPTNKDVFEIVLELLEKYGNAKNILIEGIKPKYQYLKKTSKVVAMLSNDEDGYSLEEMKAEKISLLMHSIYSVVQKDSREKGEAFLDLLNRINIRKTFNPSDEEIWVMQYLGGRSFIGKITLQDSNVLLNRITSAIKRYEVHKITKQQEQFKLQ